MNKFLFIKQNNYSSFLLGFFFFSTNRFIEISTNEEKTKAQRQLITKSGFQFGASYFRDSIVARSMTVEIAMVEMIRGTLF